MRGRSTGHVERRGAARALPFRVSRLRRAGGGPLPDRASLVEHVPFVMDQDGTGTCFACAPAVAIETTMAARGDPLGFHVSVLDLTALVHAIERADTGTTEDPLYDWGGDPRDVVTAISRWGVRPARYRDGTDEAARHCDASTDTVGPPVWHPDDRPGVEPTLLGAERAAETLLVGAYEVGDDDPVTDVRRCIAERTAVTVAWHTTLADEAAGPGALLDGRVGEPDHDSVIVAYESRPDGSFRFLLHNSWSDQWGDGGRAWVTEAFLRDARARYALDVVRRST